MELQDIADELERIRDCTHKGWALGGAKFQRLIENLGERRAAPGARGRPRLDAAD